MTIADTARQRAVTEVLHYTSNKGLMGSVIVDALLSRKQVEQTAEVSAIYEGVWDRSRDLDWIDYISMSITHPNAELLRRSANNHPDWWWAIMSFPPNILDDEGAYFTTTNNAYVDVCRRGVGQSGFDDMFSSSVPWGYYGSVKSRNSRHACNETTDRAAEVLYPRQIALDRLNCVYLPEGGSKVSLLNSWCDIYGREPPRVEIAPQLFPS